jgi:hypothetical protein
MPIAGKITITKTTMPSPPIQCVKLRQNRIEYGKDSTSGRIEDPVVVKPDDDSKNASTNEGIDPLRIYGNVPIKVRTSHDRDTDRKPSLMCTFSEEDFLEIK